MRADSEGDKRADMLKNALDQVVCDFLFYKNPNNLY